MKKFYTFFVGLFTPQTSPKITLHTQEAQNIFDYSSKVRIKMLRAAAREAQQEQAQLLKKYDARFVRTN